MHPPVRWHACSDPARQGAEKIRPQGIKIASSLSLVRIRKIEIQNSVRCHSSAGGEAAGKGKGKRGEGNRERD
jgi:hypothetical protein